jgi:hypothetical protein
VFRNIGISQHILMVIWINHHVDDYDRLCTAYGLRSVCERWLPFSIKLFGGKSQTIVA